MAIYSVLVPPSSGDMLKDSGKITFIRDGFSWAALLIPVVWILWNRMWWVFLGYLVIAVALESVAFFVPGLAPGIVATCFGLLFAFEANELKRWSLERKGWHFAGIVAGSSRDECETRFFSAWTAQEARPISPGPTVPPSALKVPSVGSRLTGADGKDVIGLFPTPETTR